MGLTDDAYRKQRAEQEPLLPGVAYAGAAAVAGSLLVNRASSMSVKILTPLALATVTGAYFLPAHYDQLKHTWIPLKVSHSGETASSSSASLQDLKRSTEGTAFDLGHKTIDTVDDIARQTQANWVDIKRKGENLAEAYKEAGQEHINKAVEKSVSETKSWLDGQRAEADRLLNKTASVITAKVGPSDHTNKFHNMSQNARESAFYKETTAGEQPSSSRWAWWSGGSSSSSPASESPASESPVSESPAHVSTTTQRPRRVSVDKSVAKAAIKQHDHVVNHASLLGLNAEETARKVHENVIDASMPKERQGRNEKHPIEISRRASESDLKDGKYIIKVNPNAKDDELPERVGGRMHAFKRDLNHGLENIDKRAHMLYDGVEHLEHKLNRRIQKNLQDEADFWHEQEMKEQANARGGSGRAM